MAQHDRSSATEHDRDDPPWRFDAVATQSLNGRWAFRTDPDGAGENEGWQYEGCDADGWDALDVPGVWDVQPEYDHYRGRAWYRRTFELDEPDHETVRLRFGAVYHRAKVWLNGVFLGEHGGARGCGYTPFEFDVTDVVRRDGENEVVVEVDNDHYQGAWWPWGGIHRDVTLLYSDAARIDLQRVTPTPNLDTGEDALSSAVRVVNAGETDRRLELSGSLRDGPGGEPLRTADDDPGLERTVTVSAGETVEVTLETTLPAGVVDRWHFDRPRLYAVETTLRDAEADRDLQRSVERVGFRRFEADGTDLLLNGERVRLNGFNRVPEDRVEGSTEPPHVAKRDVDRMKAAGANFCRIQCVPQPPDLLDYCDEQGLMLIGSIPEWGEQGRHRINYLDKERGRTVLTEMIERDYNHPAIVAWSVANEIAGTTPHGVDFVRSLFDHVTSELDESRLLTYISYTAHREAVTEPEDDASHLCDFVCVNLYRQDHAARIDRVTSVYDKPVFVSEFAGDWTLVGENPDNRAVGVADAYGTYAARESVAGCSLWTFNDYRSFYEATPPSENRAWGVQTTLGVKKRAYEQLRDIYAPVESLSVTARDGIEVTVTPKASRETGLPAYTLAGYRVVWEAIDGRADVVDGGVLALPELAPGDDPVTATADLAADADPRRVAAHLVTPTGYAVATASVDRRAPPAPDVRAVVPGDGAVRVAFEGVDDVDHRLLVRERKDGDWTTGAELTVNAFLDGTGLANDRAYDVAVEAVTDTETARSAVESVTPTADAGPLPPKVWTTVPVPDGFVVGYSAAIEGRGEVENFPADLPDDVDRLTDDSRYDLRVSDGDAVVREETFETPGVYRVDGLGDVDAQSVRLRRHLGDDTSQWSEPIPVKTADADEGPPTPTIRGVVAGSGELAVCFDPIPRASGYRLRLTDSDGATRETVVPTTDAGLHVVGGLTAGMSYTVELQARTPEGLSAPDTASGRPE